jgi:hypothetical protein
MTYVSGTLGNVNQCKIDGSESYFSYPSQKTTPLFIASPLS